MRFQKMIIPLLFCFTLAACAGTAPPPPIPVDTASVHPGTTVTRGGKTTLKLLGTPIQIGEPLPSTLLIDTNLKGTDLSTLKGQVLLLSIVPSLDTRVCERQTHILGENLTRMPEGVRLITVSRDLPFAMARFSDETGYNKILYLSDFQKADFGMATGLLVDQLQLLARSVVLVDRKGIVRYIQVVPELSHLPDMEKALVEATALAREP